MHFFVFVFNSPPPDYLQHCIHSVLHAPTISPFIQHNDSSEWPPNRIVANTFIVLLGLALFPSSSDGSSFRAFEL